MTDDRWGGISADQFKLISDKVYERLVSEHTRVSAGQLEMAKWMIASLLLINGAALAACLQSSRITGDIIKGAGIAYASGIVLAILAGLGTWMHSDRVKGILRERIDSHFLVDPERFPRRNEKIERKALVISNVSAGIGVASLICFGVGCVFVERQMPGGVPLEVKANAIVEQAKPTPAESHARSGTTRR